MSFEERYAFIADARDNPAVYEDGRLEPDFILWVVYETRGGFGNDDGLIGFTNQADHQAFLAKFTQ